MPDMNFVNPIGNLLAESRRLAGLVPQTIFLKKADPPPGSPTWRAEPMSLAKLNYDEWKGEYGAQKRMTDTYNLTNCVPLSHDLDGLLLESNGR
ncbi:hypothetical protein N7537_001488 [Penicillium hordei]|uniref:Uncharacterized protein n=1 Tax=Penicillium hordei TaxID=40994 RepID=A0AAD6EGR3_9EURO|nr:uncharacterized protein N7537_001488 [Penicillium hordei]KAJ5616374.1 hypothetical protein N7537_001488 [Penicillium hordei]